MTTVPFRGAVMTRPPIAAAVKSVWTALLDRVQRTPTDDAADARIDELLTRSQRSSRAVRDGYRALDKALGRWDRH